MNYNFDVGHGLHDLIPEFENVSYEPRIARICYSEIHHPHTIP